MDIGDFCCFLNEISSMVLFFLVVIFSIFIVLDPKKDSLKLGALCFLLFFGDAINRLSKSRINHPPGFRINFYFI